MKPEDLVKGAIRFISLPEVYLKVNSLVSNPGYSLEDICEVINRDPELASKLIKIANSPFYGFPMEIKTLAHSIRIIGIRPLCDLVLAISAINIFTDTKNEFFCHSEFWQHSLACAVMARQLSIERRATDAESVFLSGLLHDIGQLIIARKIPEMSRESHLRARDNCGALDFIEEEIMGFNHCDVGAILLDHWNLPLHIQEAIRYHHTPMTAEQFRINASLVYLSDYMISGYSQNLLSSVSIHELISLIDPNILKFFNISYEQISSAYLKTQTHIQSITDAFLPNAA